MTVSVEEKKNERIQEGEKGGRREALLT